MSTPSAPNGPVFAAPHTAPPVGTLLAPPESTRRGRPLGTWALALSVVASVLASAVGGFAAFRSARGAAPGLDTMSSNGFDWRVLSPVRDLVLLGEVAFWSGTVIGLTALVLGIVAIARRSGRGAGIAALVIAVVGPAIFAGLTLVAIVAGLAGAATGGSAV
ncbi:hypothetical protein [Microbacterium testaceum]|uniref:hypothetical protein n=1 Tax=Microbacterium testaceum TaxID=2033 RepID=UPI0012449460|nr:hypothetical protein [Microbacterium testaceum]